MSGAPIRTSLQLFRDCMRLARHLAPGHSPKRLALRTMIRSQFDAVPSSSDAHAIEIAKANAVRALSNYMLLESGTKDPKIKQAMKDQVTNVLSKNASAAATPSNKQ